MGSPSQAGAILKSQMGFRTIADSDRRSIGWMYFSGDTAATAQTLTINGRVYEFVNTAGMPGVGNVVYDMQGVGGHGAGPWTDANSATRMAALINGDATAVVEATVDASAEALMLTAKTSVAALTLATIFTGAVVSAAAFVAGSAAGEQGIIRGRYTVTAADVTKWLLGATHEVLVGCFADPGSAPFLSSFTIQTSAGIFKAAATCGARLVDQGANYALLVTDAAAVLAATDTIEWSCRASF